MVVIQQHFPQNYAFPMGVYLVIASLVSLTGAPLFEVLSTHYGWRGSLAIVAAVLMNTIACGLIYREDQTESDNEKKPLVDGASTTNGHKINVMTISPRKVPHECETSHGEVDLVCEHGITHESNAIRKSYNATYNHGYDDEAISKDGSNSIRSSQHGACNHRYDDEVNSAQFVNLDNKSSVSGYGSRDIICKHGCDDHNTMCAHQNDTAPQKGDEFKMEDTKISWLSRQTRLVTDPVIVIYLLSRTLSRGGGIITLQYTPSKAVADGISELNASFLVTIAMILMMVGRVVSTFASSFSFVNRYAFYGVTILCSAVFALLYALSRSYIAIIINIVMISFFTGKSNLVSPRTPTLMTPHI